MALKQVLLSSKIAKIRKELNPLMEKRAELKAKRDELSEEEKKLEEATEEMTEETKDEDREEVESQVEAVVEEVDTVEAAQADNEAKIAELEAKIAELEAQLAALEEGTPSDETVETVEPEVENKKRSVNHKMVTRKFFNLSSQERDAFFANAEAKSFFDRIRAAKARNVRSVTGGELLVPTVVLDIVREQVTDNSKLYKHVNVQYVNGKARQTVMGIIPAAVWTEATSKLNELEFTFNGAEVDGYKVGGYVFVPNSTLEDADNVELATVVIEGIARAIGRALDKAILYGTGVKMPTGIVTRLLQTAAPSDYPSTERAWVDLHSTNVTSITAAKSTGATLFQNIAKAFAAADDTYSKGVAFFAMNRKTYATLQAEAININAAGALVTAVDGPMMPYWNAPIEIVNDITDNVIVAGYGDDYLLAERAGTNLEQSRDAGFVEDATGFRGTARYDGKPTIAEAFVAIGINGATVTAVDF